MAKVKATVHGAVSLVSAIANKKGATLGISLKVEAIVETSEGKGVTIQSENKSLSSRLINKTIEKIVSKKDLEKIDIFAYWPTTSDIFTKELYVEEICKGDSKGLHNINVMLVFFKDKLIKVNYIHQIPETPILFQIAKNDYKINFERNKASIEKKQSEFYSTTVNDNSYFYVFLKKGNRQEEYLEIVSDKNIRKFEEFLFSKRRWSATTCAFAKSTTWI